jgi:hypothetical protein
MYYIYFIKFSYMYRYLRKKKEFYKKIALFKTNNHP